MHVIAVFSSAESFFSTIAHMCLSTFFIFVHAQSTSCPSPSLGGILTTSYLLISVHHFL